MLGLLDRILLFMTLHILGMHRDSSGLLGLYIEDDGFVMLVYIQITSKVLVLSLLLYSGSSIQGV